MRYQTPSIGSVLGLPPASLVGQQVCSLVHPEDVEEFAGYLGCLADGGTSPLVPARVRMRHRDGSWRSVETAGNNLLGDPAVAGLVLTTRDVSERRELEEQLRHQAFHDSLTGLPNRALFLERVAAAQSECDASGRPVAVIFIDLDNLKLVNDSAGHEGGDVLLATVAARLSRATRQTDTAARLGGDEFALLLVGCDTAPYAPQVAARLLAELSAPVEISGRVIRPGMSIGVATSDSLGGAEDLVRAADGAMYAAKRAGKGRVEVHQPRHHAAQLARERLRADLEHALERDEFVLHYQPIVDLVSGGIVSFEALLRWQHPERGLVPPAEFVPLAEESDLILSIGRWVLNQACQHASTWQSSGAKVSVNLSARQFRDPGLVGEVTAAASAAHLDPRLLTSS